MIDLTLHITDVQPKLIDGLKEVIDNNETIDIKVPGGIFTVILDAIGEDTP